MLRSHALVVLAHDEVDHAAHRVGAVDRRGAVLEHLDALDRRQRQHVQVDRGEAVGVVRTGHRQAVAVQQDQRRHAAQGGRAGAVAEVVAAAEIAAVAAHRRQVAQHVEYRGGARALDVLLADQGHRRDALLRDPLDVAAGDFHPLHPGRRLGRLQLLSCACAKPWADNRASANFTQRRHIFS